MTKNAKFNAPNVIELEDLKTIYAKENYDLLEEKAKDLIKKYPNVPSLYNILGVSQSSKGLYGISVFFKSPPYSSSAFSPNIINLIFSFIFL